MPMNNGKYLEVMYLLAMMNKPCLETSVHLRREQHSSCQEFSGSSLNSKWDQSSALQKHSAPLKGLQVSPFETCIVPYCTHFDSAFSPSLALFPAQICQITSLPCTFGNALKKDVFSHHQNKQPREHAREALSSLWEETPKLAKVTALICPSSFLSKSEEYLFFMSLHVEDFLKPSTQI